MGARREIVDNKIACCHCKEVLPLTAFGPDSSNSFGIDGWCRGCRRASHRKRNRNNVAKLSAKKKVWVSKNRDKQYSYNRKFVVALKEKALVPYSKVYRAKKSGKLLQLPCQICGDLNSQAHHPDYSKPLDVIWLCKKHHAEEHRKHKALIAELEKKAGE